MKDRIIENIHHPEHLEQLYRENKKAFSESFAQIQEEYDSELVRFWKIRLAEGDGEKGISLVSKDVWVVVFLGLVSWVLLKLPAIWGQINEELFYQRGLAIIVFNGIILFTMWQNRDFNKRNMLTYGLVLAVVSLFISLLPTSGGDSIVLALIHTPLFLWCLFGLAYMGFDYKNMHNRMAFIRFNGELLIMTGLILIAGAMLTGITIGLFSAISMDIEHFYVEYIATLIGMAAPLVSLYLISLNPTLTRKIAPIIARAFTPLVLITLAVYLVSLVFSGSQILDDRNLLLVLNIMLIAVVAIIVFSVSELDKQKEKNIHVLILFMLAALAIVVNAIALVGITSRVAGGLTPNRTVVLVFNLLIFVNLILMTRNLLKSYYDRRQLVSVEQTVARYLTVYAGWVVVVIFVLPFIFGMQ